MRISLNGRWVRKFKHLGVDLCLLLWLETCKISIQDCLNFLGNSLNTSHIILINQCFYMISQVFHTILSKLSTYSKSCYFRRCFSKCYLFEQFWAVDYLRMFALKVLIKCDCPFTLYLLCKTRDIFKFRKAAHEYIEVFLNEISCVRFYVSLYYFHIF